MDYLDKLDRLYQLAENDDIYQTWKHGFEELSVPFKLFAESQPIEIRRLLYGYTDAGRMMAQRVSNIACQYMEFIEQKESGVN